MTLTANPLPTAHAKGRTGVIPSDWCHRATPSVGVNDLSYAKNVQYDVSLRARTTLLLLVLAPDTIRLID